MGRRVRTGPDSSPPSANVPVAQASHRPSDIVRHECGNGSPLIACCVCSSHFQPGEKQDNGQEVEQPSMHPVRGFHMLDDGCREDFDR